MSLTPSACDWAQFDPAAYLEEYYGDVGSENLALLRFLAEAYRDLPAGGRMLDFGGGPTIYPLISAVTRVAEIHFCDFLEANLREVQRWLDGDPQAFDWSEFVGLALEIETGAPGGAGDVARREREIRKRVTRLSPCDASRTPPVEGAGGPYDLLVTNFCAESATSDRLQWQAFVHNITSLVRPGGGLVMSALKGARSYSVGPRSFPAVEIVEEDLIEVLLDAGFSEKTIEVRAVPADRPTRDYEGLLLAKAIKESGEPAEGGG